MKDTSSVATQARAKERKDSYNTAEAQDREAVAANNLEMSKYGIMAILAVGGVVGLFGLLFLVGGMISAGNPLSFVSKWVTAAFGV